MRREFYLTISISGLALSLVDFQTSLTGYVEYFVLLLAILAVILFHRSARGEYYRKIVHILCCLLLHFLYISFGYSLSLLTLSILVLIGSLAVERVDKLGKITKSVINKFSRENEPPGYCALNLASGALLVLLLQFFIKIEYSTLSIVISGIGDSIASLAGLHFGKHRLLNKSIEGAFALFIVISAATYTIVGYFSLIVAFISAVGELCSPVDDNIVLPPLLYILLCFSTLVI